MMRLNNKKSKRSFTIIELVISLALLTIIAGSFVTMKVSFSRRQKLTTSALQLVTDLRLAQQFSRAYKDEYKYYGIRLYENLGPDSDRNGYKIIRYNPPGGVDPLDMDPPVDNTNIDIIKTSEDSDVAGNSVEVIDNTFFAARVLIDATSDFQKFVIITNEDQIVFTPEGSATTDGETLLVSGTNDEIVLSIDQDTVTIEIIPLTGYVRIQ